MKNYISFTKGYSVSELPFPISDISICKIFVLIFKALTPFFC